jgi:putative N6-adenine-specific DNA methylase
MLLNLESRLAQRVLIEVAHGEYRNEDDLYALARSIDWGDWITPRQTLRVDSTAQKSPLKSLNFAALRVKDAVCDQLREASGERPSVDVERPDLTSCASSCPGLCRDSGESHSSAIGAATPATRRSRRLAAAMLAAAGAYPGDRRPLRSVCGSSTIAEAAQIACGIAPGRCAVRLQRLLPFTSVEMRTGCSACWPRRNGARAGGAVFAGDLSFRMVDFAQPMPSARRRPRDPVQYGDALERPAPSLPPELPGTLMLNPPYGERIEVGGKAARDSAEDRSTPSDFFARLATHWKKAYTGHPGGWTAWILSPDMRLPSAMRLKESRRVTLWNGPIECRLFRFELVAGSARAKSASEAG